MLKRYAEIYLKKSYLPEILLSAIKLYQALDRVLYSQVLAHFNVELSTGLSHARVEEAQIRFGKNELAPEPGER